MLLFKCPSCKTKWRNFSAFLTPTGNEVVIQVDP